MNHSDSSLSLVHGKGADLNLIQKSGLAMAALGFLILFLAFVGVTYPSNALFLGLSTLLFFSGATIYARQSYLTHPEGIKNNGVWLKSMTNGKAWGWVFAIIITGFYVLLYWFPALLGLGAKGASNNGVIALFDPLSQLLKGKAASQWFMYGTLYTIAILAMGIKFIYKYRHNKYQVLRTISVMFFQLALAFLLPEILEGLNADMAYFAKDLKNMWPLNYYFYEEWHMNAMLEGGNLGMFFLFWGVLMTVVISPILTYKYGKRWYCSWVCGCGGLAETAGDPYRQLSDKSLEAWQIERIIIYGVLALILVTTGLVLYTYFTGNALNFGLNKYLLFALLLATGAGLFFWQRKNYPYLSQIKTGGVILVVLAIVFTYFSYQGGATINFSTFELRKWYGFLIGAAFSGVVGVGFYPIMGSRVWCRFGCPMAAILGMQQKFFSRFRITTNGSQCISCGNCSTYCEMGIDVRSYAQKGQDIVRASCVGCGICAAVCPRGVLRLENGSDIQERTKDLRVIHIGRDDVGLLN